VVILQIDGFHEDADPKNVLYVGMTRARDKLVVVGPPKYLKLVQDAADASQFIS
jgi:ATP-dependent exoDNAse (exonuclease V) alpha subunit